MPRLLDAAEVARSLMDLPGWTRAPGEGAAIRTTVTLADFAAALAFVNAVGREAEEMDHHPDIDIRWNQVSLVLSTHSEGGLTQLDIELAHRISALPQAG